MGKIDALFILESGYINIISGIYIYKSCAGVFLQVADLPGLLKGGKFEIKATTPEDARQEIKNILTDIYKNSCDCLIEKIANI